MLDYFNKNSPLMNTLIVYLFIMYLLFMNNPNMNGQLFVVLPVMIYSFFVFFKINK